MAKGKSQIWNLTAFLTIIWALSIIYGEMFSFWLPSCSWPHLQMKGLSSSSDYVKVAVIADPQLMDRTCIDLPPKSVALEIAKFYTDLFMRRAFLSSILPLKPDVVLFLGDYFDGGSILSNDEWEESLSRFKHIFDVKLLQQAGNVKVHFLAGNHDVGYAAAHTLLPEVIRRYENIFGERNYRFTVGKVDFIAIDAQTLDGNPLGHMTSDTWNFVFNLSKDSSSAPRILLTHIPLYRPDSTSCGRHRASPIIDQRISRSPYGEEILYQNYITQNSSMNLLNLIKPALVLSGHDHDQCTTTHVSKFGTTTEHTVGTISWQQGNLYPSFMLLSASNHDLHAGSELQDVISTQLCFLPVQTFIYLWYLSLFIITLVLVFLWPTKDVFFFQFKEYVNNMNSSIFGGVSKEKNEDEDCEYEMVWDAEGTMHLIKQASKAPSRSSVDKNPVERGNAVFRSTAKRQTGPEVDASLPLDVNIHVGLDTSEPVRTRKSKRKLVLSRLLRSIVEKSLFRFAGVIALSVQLEPKIRSLMSEGVEALVRLVQRAGKHEQEHHQE